MKTGLVLYWEEYLERWNKNCFTKKHNIYGALHHLPNLAEWRQLWKKERGWVNPVSELKDFLFSSESMHMKKVEKTKVTSKLNIEQYSTTYTCIGTWEPRNIGVSIIFGKGRFQMEKYILCLHVNPKWSIDNVFDNSYDLMRIFLQLLRAIIIGTIYNHLSNALCVIY